MITTFRARDDVIISTVDQQSFEELKEKAKAYGYSVNMAISSAGARFICNNLDADFGSFINTFTDYSSVTPLVEGQIEHQFIEYDTVVDCYILYQAGPDLFVSRSEIGNLRLQALLNYVSNITLDKKIYIREKIRAHLSHQERRYEQLSNQLGKIAKLSKCGGLSEREVFECEALNEADKLGLLGVLSIGTDESNSIITMLAESCLERIYLHHEYTTNLYESILENLIKNKAILGMRGGIEQIRAALRAIDTVTTFDSMLLKVSSEYVLITVFDEYDFRLYEFVDVDEVSESYYAFLREHKKDMALIPDNAADIILRNDF